jgi:hypothetical protein
VEFYIPYAQASHATLMYFFVFIDTHYKVKKNLLTSDHWYIVEHVLEFLELFYLSIVSLSGVYYPTFPLMMHVVIEIAAHLNLFENDSKLRPVIVPMKSKFQKYWENIPLVYSFAFILDPRAKLTNFNNALHVLSDSLHPDYSSYSIEVKTQLSILYAKYESKFGSVRLQRPQPITIGPGNVLSSWNRFVRTNPSSSSVSTGTVFNTPISSTISELSSYLDSDPLTEFDDSFSVLSWWCDHKRTYPILSILAKDVLIVLVSTISSESAFSLCGRLIEERWRSLTPELVEMLSLAKDWEQAAVRQQHYVENKGLEELMANMYLDAQEEGSTFVGGGDGHDH